MTDRQTFHRQLMDLREGFVSLLEGLDRLVEDLVSENALLQARLEEARDAQVRVIESIEATPELVAPAVVAALASPSVLSAGDAAKPRRQYVYFETTTETCGRCVQPFSHRRRKGNAPAKYCPPCRKIVVSEHMRAVQADAADERAILAVDLALRDQAMTGT